MEIGKRDLEDGLRALGIAEGDEVLVHSAMGAIGRIDGGAEALIAALVAAVGKEGTLLFPTLTGTAQDGPARPPRFDARSSACWTGRVPETARTLPGAFRSLHPTHSVAAIGARARRYSTGHELGASPCDRASPYYALTESETGRILLIGVGMNSCTNVHCAEEAAGVPYHLQREPTDCAVVDASGRELVVRNRLHDWGKPATDFDKFLPLLEAGGALRWGKLGAADCLLLGAKKAHGLMAARLLAEPSFLLSG